MINLQLVLGKDEAHALPSVASTFMKHKSLLAEISKRRDVSAKARKLYSERLAPDFNIFDFLRRNEIGISAILAWLLDPSASHGQGRKFLENFLRWVGKDWRIEDNSTVEVATERRAGMQRESERRIDVYVSHSDWCFGIENKIWGARDLPDQINDYVEYLKKRRPRGRFFLLYLSKDGKPPSGESRRTSEVGNYLVLKSYADLADWIRANKSVCGAHNVGFFLLEFENFLNRELGNMSDGERTELLNLIISDPEWVASAIEISNVNDDMVERLIGLVPQQLQEALCKNIKVTTSGIAGDESFGWEAKLPSGHVIKFDFGDKNYRDFGYGLRRSSDSDAKLSELLTQHFGEGEHETEQWWHWCQAANPNDRWLPVARDWRRDPATWKEIASRDMGKKMAKVVEEFAQILRDNGYISD